MTSLNRMNKNYFILVIFLLIFVLGSEQIISTPLPIYGKVEFSDGTTASNALINVSSEHGYLITYSDDQGYWRVDVGYPLNWPKNLSVNISGSKTINNSVWNGFKEIILHSGSINVGTIHFFLKHNTTETEDIPTSPVAIINNHFIEQMVGVPVFFNASESYYPNGNIIGYRWDFTSDGIFDTEWSKNHTQSYTFHEPGRYSTVLQVKNNENITNSTTALVHIISEETYIKLRIPEGIESFQHVSFEFEKIQDVNTTNITWMIDDDIVSYDTLLNYTFNTSGMYQVKVYVEDTQNRLHHDNAQIQVEARQKQSSSDEPIPEDAGDTNGFNIILLFFTFSIFLIIKGLKKRKS